MQIQQGTPMAVQWKIMATDVNTGELVYEEESHNLVVRGGRKNSLQQIFNLGSPLTYLYCGVGSGSSDAAITDTGLGAANANEITSTNSGTRIALTDTSGGALDVTDITQETTVVSGFIFDQKIVVQATYSVSDCNNTTFREYALYNSGSFPTVNIFNHFVASADLNKTASLEVIAQITIRS